MDRSEITPVGFDISSFAHIEHSDFGDSGLYRALHNETGAELGQVYYVLPISEPDVMITQTVYTDPNWRGRQISEALIERMVFDHMDRYVDIGAPIETHPLPEFVAALQASMPYFNAVVIQAGARG